MNEFNISDGVRLGSSINYNALYQNILGITNENIKISIPNTKKVIAFCPAPDHSLSITPQTLLNITFSAISILHEKAIITLPGSKKLCPMPNPKN